MKKTEQKNTKAILLAGAALGVVGMEVWKRWVCSKNQLERLFRDKVAIVTGGASGIGRGLCDALAGYGATVVVADIQEEGAQLVAEGIVRKGGRSSAHRLDVSVEAEVEALVDKAVATYGRLDYMFNNAGIAIAGFDHHMGSEDWRRIIDVNLWGVIYGTRAAYRVMQAQKSGHIVNTASVAGLVPAPGLAGYATAKHGVVGLSTSLRPEARMSGVRISAVCPGYIQTNVVDAGTILGAKKRDVQDFLALIPAMPADACARVVLCGVAQNKAIIPVTGATHVLWGLNRLHPSLLAPGLSVLMRYARTMEIEVE